MNELEEVRVIRGRSIRNRREGGHRVMVERERWVITMHMKKGPSHMGTAGAVTCGESGARETRERRELKKKGCDKGVECGVECGVG